jgi:hypothetical protein
MEREPSKTAFTPGYVKDPPQVNATVVPLPRAQADLQKIRGIAVGRGGQNRAGVPGITPGLRQSCQGRCEY